MTSTPAHRRTLALTFDDGPGPSTAALLDVLASHGARATFFLLGCNVDGRAMGGDGVRARALCVRLLREGHAAGNHTLTHTREPMAAEALAREVHAMDGVLAGLHAEAGRAVPSAFPVRLPYGPLVRDGNAMDERLGVLAAIGRSHEHWTGIFGDWEAHCEAGALADALDAHVRAQWALGLRAVPVLHDAGSRRRANGFDRGATVEALARVLPGWVRDGAVFVTVG